MSSYLQLLPAIYSGQDRFVGRFLLAFEQVLTGLPGDAKARGLEQTIADMALLFNPQGQVKFLDDLGASPQARAEFLAWLSGWVALSRRFALEQDQQRAFLAQACLLYRRRGTRESLEKLLKIYLEPTAIIEEGDELPADERGLLHHFHVTIHLQATQDQLDVFGAKARALIELAKPAHTTYVLEFRMPTLRIFAGEKDEQGKPTARVGVDTTLTRFENLPQENQHADPRKVL